MESFFSCHYTNIFPKSILKDAKYGQIGQCDGVMVGDADSIANIKEKTKKKIGNDCMQAECSNE